MKSVNSIHAYAVCNKEDNIREQSSSGGVFYLIARYVIENGGVVFGAKFNEAWGVEHDFTEDLSGILTFMQSKYVQSSMGNMYKKVQEFLQKNRMVLFSGTPCQIYGLKTFLGNDYDNLITVDFICHGVPSPMVWRKYLREMCGKHEITGINFRDKTEGWLDFSLKIDYCDGSYYRKNLHQDIFLKGFQQNIYLRPSCYECQFKGVERTADITIADFWGVQKMLPDFFDNKGTSVVLVRSENALRIFGKIESAVRILEVNTAYVEKSNPAVSKSVKRNKKRELFYSLCGDNVITAMEACTKESCIGKFVKWGKRVVKKVLFRERL